MAKATEVIAGYKSGKLVLPTTLSQFLQDWLRVHIFQADKKMIQHV